MNNFGLSSCEPAVGPSYFCWEELYLIQMYAHTLQDKEGLKRQLNDILYPHEQLKRVSLEFKSPIFSLSHLLFSLLHTPIIKVSK